MGASEVAHNVAVHLEVERSQGVDVDAVVQGRIEGKQRSAGAEDASEGKENHRGNRRPNGGKNDGEKLPDPAASIEFSGFEDLLINGIHRPAENDNITAKGETNRVENQGEHSDVAILQKERPIPDSTAILNFKIMEGATKREHLNEQGDQDGRSDDGRKIGDDTEEFVSFYLFVDEIREQNRDGERNEKPREEINEGVEHRSPKRAIGVEEFFEDANVIVESEIVEDADGVIEQSDGRVLPERKNERIQMNVEPENQKADGRQKQYAENE